MQVFCGISSLSWQSDSRLYIMSSQAGSPVLYPISFFSTGEICESVCVLFMLLSLCHHVFFRGSQSHFFFTGNTEEYIPKYQIKFYVIEGGLCVVFQFLLASSSSSPEGTGTLFPSWGASYFAFLSNADGTNKIYHRVKSRKGRLIIQIRLRRVICASWVCGIALYLHKD